MTVDLALVTETDAHNPVEGDLRVDAAALAMVEGGDAIAQEIRVRLRWWHGEWFLDTTQGTPYLEQLLGKGVTEPTIRTVLRKEIEQVPGVARVTSLEVSIDRATRYATVDLEVLTTEGDELELAGVAVGGGA